MKLNELNNIEVNLFNIDHQEWLTQTINHLRTQNIEQVNQEILLKELNSLAISEKLVLQNSIRVLMTYLLEFMYQPEFHSEIATSMIIEQFRRSEEILLASPSLKTYYFSIFSDCYRKAINDLSVKSGLPVDIFPSKPTFSSQDLLDTDFVFGLLKSSTYIRPHISVVIPVYKAENSLNELYTRLKLSLQLISEDFEIILVEDCGGDRSWEIILELSQLDPRVKGIQFSRNFGQHYGITAGLDHCDGDWVVIMDCDLQDKPEEIIHLYAKAQEGYDIVLARRGKRKDPLLKRVTSWMFYKIFNYFTDLQYDSEVGNFRIVSRKVVESFCVMREQLRFFGGLIDWLGFPSSSIDVQHEERFAGKSTYTFVKLWKLAIETIIAYSDKPLRSTIRLGFIISTSAFIYGIYLLSRVLFYGSSVTGWSSLIVSLFLLGGIIISILGILGIYLGKTFDEVKKRPLYLIRSSTFKFSIYF